MYHVLKFQTMLGEVGTQKRSARYTNPREYARQRSGSIIEIQTQGLNFRNRPLLFHSQMQFPIILQRIPSHRVKFVAKD